MTRTKIVGLIFFILAFTSKSWPLEKGQKLTEQSITSELRSKRIAYLRIPVFNSRTPDEVRRALDELQRQAAAPLVGIILDLRGNLGGLFYGCVETVRLFVNHGIIVSTVSISPKKEREDFSANAWNGEFTQPMVVVVDSRTAAAAELVCGSLQQLKRATLIGQKTAGKGAVEIEEPLSDGTSRRQTLGFFLITGRSPLNEIGVTPDQIVKDASGEDILSLADHVIYRDSHL